MSAAGDPSRVAIDGRLRARLLAANRTRCERVAFLLGARAGAETRVVAAVFPPLTAAEPTRAAFDMRWHTILRTTLERLGLLPAIRIVGWMHSHPRLSIFLSATDLPTARAFLRSDPETVAVVVNPFDGDDPIGAFRDGEGRVRVPVEFRRLREPAAASLGRLAALGAALPDYEECLLPDWVAAADPDWRAAHAALAVRMLEGQRLILHRIDALAAAATTARAREVEVAGTRRKR